MTLKYKAKELESVFVKIINKDKKKSYWRLYI